MGVAERLPGDLLDDWVGLGVDGGGMSRGLSPLRMRRKPAACSKVFGADAGDLFELGAGAEAAVLVAVGSTMLRAVRSVMPAT